MKSLPERGSGVCVKTGRHIAVQTNSTTTTTYILFIYRDDMSVLYYAKMGEVKPSLQKPTIQ